MKVRELINLLRDHDANAEVRVHTADTSSIDHHDEPCRVVAVKASDVGPVLVFGSPLPPPRPGLN